MRGEGGSDIDSRVPTDTEMPSADAAVDHKKHPLKYAQKDPTGGGVAVAWDGHLVEHEHASW
jgi:hypothetical protein